MTSSPSPVLFVCAGVLIDTEGRILLAQRPQGKSLAGLWEFPGGKIHEGERPEEALSRELKEELSIDVPSDAFFPLTFVSHPTPSFHLFMPLFGCRTWQGIPKPLEGQAYIWAKRNELNQYPMPAADELVLPTLMKLL